MNKCFFWIVLIASISDTFSQCQISIWNGGLESCQYNVVAPGVQERGSNAGLTGCLDTNPSGNSASIPIDPSQPSQTVEIWASPNCQNNYGQSAVYTFTYSSAGGYCSYEINCYASNNQVNYGGAMLKKKK